MNCLVKQFAICLDVVAIFWFNVVEVGEVLCWIYRVWSSKVVLCVVYVVVFGLSVRLSWYPMWMRWLL